MRCYDFGAEIVEKSCVRREIKPKTKKTLPATALKTQFSNRNYLGEVELKDSTKIYLLIEIEKAAFMIISDEGYYIIKGESKEMFRQIEF